MYIDFHQETGERKKEVGRFVEAQYILYVFSMVTNRRQDCLEPESRWYAKMT